MKGIDALDKNPFLKPGVRTQRKGTMAEQWDGGKITKQMSEVTVS